MEKQGETYTIIYPDGTQSEEFEDFPSAHARAVNVSQNSPMDKSGYGGVRFTGDFEGLCVDGIQWNGRIYPMFTDENDIEWVESQLLDTHILNRQYDADPMNPDRASSFITEHPVTWTKHSEPDAAWGWAVAGIGLPPNYRMKRGEDEEGEYWSLEGLVHEAPEYTELTHDPRLDVKSRTQEGAILSYAQKLDEFYERDGTPRVEE